jgi:hypothetical protein
MREFQLLVGATLYLMSRHAETGSPRLAGAIVRHLELLGAHPHASSLIRDWSAQLLSDWRQRAAHR